MGSYLFNARKHICVPCFNRCRGVLAVMDLLLVDLQQGELSSNQATRNGGVGQCGTAASVSTGVSGHTRYYCSLPSSACMSAACLLFACRASWLLKH